MKPEPVAFEMVVPPVQASITPMSGPTPMGDDCARSTAHVVHVLLVDCEPTLAGLISEWLRAEGLEVQTGWTSGDMVRGISNAPPAPALVLAELAHPSRCGVDSLRQRLGPARATTPIVVLSSMFFASVECCGPVARRLGVHGVLPTPTTREALLALVSHCLRPACPASPHAAA